MMNYYAFVIFHSIIINEWVYKNQFSYLNYMKHFDNCGFLPGRA